MEIWRATFGPPPAWRALPNMVSSILSGCTPARSIASLAATTPISAAVIEASEPPNLPIGVRTADRMYTSRKQDLQKLLVRSEEHTSELQSHSNLVCRLLLEKKKKYLVDAFPKLTAIA